MKLKIGSLLVAVAIVAFAAPAMAGASTGLTDGGVLVPVGTTITGSNVGSVTTTAATLGNTSCESLMFNVELNQNSAATGFTALGITTGSMSGCVWNGTAVKATNVTVVEITSPGGSSGTGKASFSYEIDYPGLTCKYTASGAAFAYTAGSDAINFTKAPLTSSPAACGTTTFDASVTLSTPGSGTPIVIM
jgi:hypothetical protein